MKILRSQSPIARLALALMVSLGAITDAAATDPVLRFPDGITWKGIFDSGFRPKHVSGLERDTCRIADQSFQFEFMGTPELFPVDRGSLTFQLKPDDSLRMIWHQSRVPVSMEEGRRRLEQFEKLVDGHIFQKGRMPVLLDKATATVRTEREYDSIALVDGYVIHYGFDSSFKKDAPLIPHFYVSSRGYMGEPILRSKTVTPPEGYEWYSLDPKIDTPAPGIRRPMSEVEPTAVAERPRQMAQKKRQETQKAADPSGFNPLWLIAVLGGIFIVAALAIVLRFRKA